MAFAARSIVLLVSLLLLAGICPGAQDMISVPGGDFWMGVDATPDSAPAENPRHLVHVRPFAISRNLVTNAQFARFVAATGYKPRGLWSKDADGVSGEDMHPAVLVAWYDAQAYARWAGGRLPEEEEWERAARGTDGRIFPWGNKFDPDLLDSSVDGGARGTLVVGSFPDGASPYGVLDMAGNVWQWTASWFHSYPGGPPEADSTDRYKTVRGGSWEDRDRHVFRATYRTGWPPDIGRENTGFRYVVDL